MKIIVNGKEQELDKNVDRIEYITLCKIAGKDPNTKPTVTVKNQYGQSELKDGQQCFCYNEMIVNVINTSDA